MTLYKFAIMLLIFTISIVFLLPLVYTVSPFTLNPNSILIAPSFEHIMGTDRLGRDIFARILEGGQTSLIIGFISALISSFIGLFVGINAGYFKGKVDKTTTIVIDLFLTFPTFFFITSTYLLYECIYLDFNYSYIYYRVDGNGKTYTK